MDGNGRAKNFSFFLFTFIQSRFLAENDIYLQEIFIAVVVIVVVVAFLQIFCKPYSDQQH